MSWHELLDEEIGAVTRGIELRLTADQLPALRLAPVLAVSAPGSSR
jgi:hypothetical protein